jgi:hypothetical protein
MRRPLHGVALSSEISLSTINTSVRPKRRALPLAVGVRSTHRDTARLYINHCSGGSVTPPPLSPGATTVNYGFAAQINQNELLTMTASQPFVL